MAPPAAAVILPSGVHIAPFGDPVADSQVLGRSLRVVQREALAEVGVQEVSTPPSDQPYLLLSDRTWVTGGALRRFLAVAQAPARLRVCDPDWLAMTATLQDTPEPGLYEVALLPAGAPPRFDGLPAVDVDLEFERTRPVADHPALAHALPGSLPVSDGGVHQLDHWTHILRVNWLAMTSTIQREKRKFEALLLPVKVWKILGLVLKARSLNRFRLAAALTRTGKGCSIHPTAVVEASVLGDGVEIGPFAVVRGSVLGDGVKVEEYGAVNASVLGAKAHIGKRGTANLCVLYPGAYLSCGNGHQASLLGRDSFLAWSVTIFDLSFAGPVRVWHRGQRVSAGTHFLGAVLGHRARLGGQVSLGYGAEVPNDTFVVGDSSPVLREVAPGPSPHRVRQGVAQPVRPSAAGEPTAGGPTAGKPAPCEPAPAPIPQERPED